MVRIQDLKHLPGTRKNKRGGSKENVRRETTARGAMQKTRYVRVIRKRRSEEMTQSNTFSHRGRKYLLSPRVGDDNLSPPE